MIIYRDSFRTADPTEEAAAIVQALARLRAAPGDYDIAAEALIRFGALESAWADALAPDIDEDSPEGEALDAAARALGHVFLAAIDGYAGAARIAAAGDAIAALPAPPVVPMRLKAAEGFAYYALFPEAYAATARAAAPEGPAFVLGLRSIGAPLSAVAAAALEREGRAVQRATIRPRGPAFDRRPLFGPALARRLAAHRGGILVVDEGPGLSGSSFCGTAAALEALDVPPARILFLPAHDPAPESFANEDARRVWNGHARFPAAPVLARLRREREGADAQDLSGGLWRARLLPGEEAWPPVHPHHERQKALVWRGGERALAKFAGLGQPQRIAMARQLAEAGYAPPVIAAERGHLVTRFIDGTPLTQRDAEPAFLAHAARYIAFRAERFPLSRADAARLAEAFVQNARQILGEGDEAAAAIEAGRRCVAGLAGAPRVAVDGRMEPHEWLRTPTGFIKADAVDHHDDHFMPGPMPWAYDAAGVGLGFGLSLAREEALADEIGRALRDPAGVEALPACRLVLLSQKGAYAAFARWSLGGGAEADRFAALEARCRARLLEALHRTLNP